MSMCYPYSPIRMLLSMFVFVAANMPLYDRKKYRKIRNSLQALSSADISTCVFGSVCCYPPITVQLSVVIPSFITVVARYLLYTVWWNPSFPCLELIIFTVKTNTSSLPIVWWRPKSAFAVVMMLRFLSVLVYYRLQTRSITCHNWYRIPPPLVYLSSATVPLIQRDSSQTLSYALSACSLISALFLRILMLYASIFFVVGFAQYVYIQHAFYGPDLYLASIYLPVNPSS